MAANGYVRVWVPGHPTASKDGYALEHRYLIHEAGTELPSGKHVHHINGDRADNRLENLIVLTVQDHVVGHINERGHHRNQYGAHPRRAVKPCARCGREFMPWKPTGKYCSRACANKRKETT